MGAMTRALLPLLLAIVGCTAREAPAVVIRPPTDDPRVAVTSWSQVQRFHCARGEGGAVTPCARDADCADGRVCDTSGGCGCCVPPPPRVDPSVALRRYLFTACVEQRCAPPPYCTPSPDGATCTMRFDREVPLWVSTWVAPQGESALAETRRALCILVEPHQDCMWTLEIPGGEYTADAPVPTRYEGSYECGGRTCNGVEAVRASPRVGSSYTVRLTAQRCGG